MASDAATDATAARLRTLRAVRETAAPLARAPPGVLQHFDVSLPALDTYAARVAALVARDYAGAAARVPPHTRWRHFCVTGPAGAAPAGVSGVGGGEDPVAGLAAAWRAAGVGRVEVGRRVVDLFVVSVLLDAGAGAAWRYRGPAASARGFAAADGVGRSEGLALASLDWFAAGGLSGTYTAAAAGGAAAVDDGLKWRADAAGLRCVDAAAVATALQADAAAGNAVEGLEGRAGLLRRLGDACAERPEYFGGGPGGRPGMLVDYLLAKVGVTAAEVDARGESNAAAAVEVPFDALWEVIVDGLGSVWPATRTRLGGVSLGDVWPCEARRRLSELEGSSAAAPG
ncbi:hypothetical protein HK405_002527, partial [Cladochytrium tenue]